MDKKTKRKLNRQRKRQDNAAIKLADSKRKQEFAASVSNAGGIDQLAQRQRIRRAGKATAKAKARRISSGLLGKTSKHSSVDKLLASIHRKRQPTANLAVNVSLIKYDNHPIIRVALSQPEGQAIALNLVGFKYGTLCGLDGWFIQLAQINMGKLAELSAKIPQHESLLHSLRKGISHYVN